MGASDANEHRHDQQRYLIDSVRVVLHWLSRDLCQLLMFCPHLQSSYGHHHTQYRKVNNRKLSTKDIAWISKTVPSTLSESLLSKVRNATTQLEKEVVVEAIVIVPWGLNVDDSLADIRHKLSISAFHPVRGDITSSKDMDAQVYIWSTTTIPKDVPSSSIIPSLCIGTVMNAFNDRTIIPKSELLSFASCHIESLQPFDPSKDRDELLTQWQAYRVLVQRLSQDNRMLRVSKPLDFEIKFDGYDVRMPPNPFFKRQHSPNVDGNMVMGDGTPRHLYTVLNLDGNVLSTAAGVDSQLNMCIASNVLKSVLEHVSQGRRDNNENQGQSKDAFRMYWLNGFVRKYFPFMTESSGSTLHDPGFVDENRLRDAALHNAFKGVMRREDDVLMLHTYDNKKTIPVRVQDEAISYLQIRVNERNINGHVDLRSIFDAFHVSVRTPMVIFYDGDTTLYKVEANEARGGGIPPAKLASWIQRKPQQRPDEPYLQFITNLSAPNDKLYCKIIVRSDLSYEIRQHLPSILSANVESVQNVIQHVGDLVIRTIQSMFVERTMNIPLPDTLFIQHTHKGQISSNTRLSNCVTTTVYQSPSVLPSLAIIEKAVSTSFMQSHFIVIARNASSLVLKYRRTDIPTRQVSVNDVIRGMRDMPKEEIVMQLQDMFNMDTQTAVGQVEEWFLEASLERDFNGRQQKYFSRWYNGGDVATRPIIVRIAHPHKITGCSVIVEGVTDIELLQRVRRTVQVLLSIAISPPPNDAPSKRVREATNNAIRESDHPIDENVNIESLHELDEDDDLKALFDSELDSMLNTKASSQPPSQVESSNTTRNTRHHDADDDNIKSNKVILNRLYRADPALFQAKLSAGARYSRVCVKSDARQPIVITEEEKNKIDRVSPGSYEGFVRAGSTPELAKKNIYICPYVWCPKSRVSLSEEQFNRNGNKCPKSTNAEEEIPIVLNAKYWQGRNRHPGLLEARHHPQGMCMPCCFAKPNRISGECALTVNGTTKTRAGVASDNNQPDNSDGNRYIRGDVYPLGKDTYGVLPITAAKFLGNTMCGNRDDGSGQIIASTKCFVRRGMSTANQPFFEALSHITKSDKNFPDDSNERALDIVRRIRESLTLSVYMGVQDGDLCRRFMTPSPPLDDAKILSEFAKWVVARGRPRAKDGVAHELFRAATAAKNQRDDKTFAGFLAQNLAACMEFVLFASWRAFLNYLDDNQSVKTHHTIIDIFNGTPGSPLNPRGINLIVIERNPDSGHVYGFTSTPQSLRINSLFVVLVKTSTFYEPMYRVTMNNGKANANMFFSYHSSPPLRSIIDNVYTRGSGSMINVLSVLDQPAISQIIDFRFKCIALVTKSGVAVPMLPACSIHPSLTSLMHLRDIHELRPTISVDSLRKLFARIAALTGNAGYKVIREERVQSVKRQRTSALVLGCGFVVPIEITPNDAQWDTDRRVYLQNLNVFVGLSRSDKRTEVINHELAKSTALGRVVAKVTTTLQSDSRAMEEYRFLRSSFNPFPLDYRRAKMVDLVRALGIDIGKRPGATIDSLLFGDDILDDAKMITVAAWVKPQSESKFIIFSDADLTQGALEAAVAMTLQRHSSFSVDFELNNLLKSSQHVDTMRTQLNNYALLTSMNRLAQQDRTPPEAIQDFSRRSRRLSWTLYMDVNMFTVISMICRVTGSNLSDNMVRSVLKDQVMMLLHASSLAGRIVNKRNTDDIRAAGKTLSAIDSPSYRPGLADVELLARACKLNITVLELKDVKRRLKNKPITNVVKHRFINVNDELNSRVLMTSVFLMHDDPPQFDIVLNRQRGKLLSFDDAHDLPEIERLLYDVIKQA